MKKVLIIEDEMEFRKSVSDMLRYENFKVLTAENGIKGLELAKKECPDVILCDIMMPELNGYEVLKNLNKKCAPLPVPFIFLTALNRRKNYRQGMELGADDYLTKPFTREELLEAISSRLEKYIKIESYIDRKITEIEARVESKIKALQQEVEEKNSSLFFSVQKSEILGKKLNEKEVELINETFSAIETNNTLQELRNLIKREIQNPTLPEESKQLLLKLKNKAKRKTVLNNNWMIFQIKFNQAHPNLISALTSHFADLTQYEIVFISAHIMGLNTSQLADLLNITNDSVRKSRYRLKKKLGLKKEDNFLHFIHNLNLKKENA